ncbi:MAG: hypothetical protein ACM37U_02690 [Gemmatimonas sp.]
MRGVTPEGSAFVARLAADPWGAGAVADPPDLWQAEVMTTAENTSVARARELFIRVSMQV